MSAKVIPAKVITSFDRAGVASSEIAQLPRKRLVCCSELNCSDILNEGKIKILSGGETVSARELYGKSFTFDPECKFISILIICPRSAVQTTAYGAG